jgi:hypothetical protein
LGRVDTETIRLSHLKFVLMSIAETRSNDRELGAPVIWTISDLIVAHPKWADRVTDWLAAFDKVDLRQLRALANLNKSAVKPRAALATLWIPGVADGSATRSRDTEEAGAAEGGMSRHFLVVASNRTR